MTLTCKLCSKDWERPNQRGRTPTICPTCKEKIYGVKPANTPDVRKPLVGKARTERLEMMLRANNVHIQQHMKDDE